MNAHDWMDHVRRAAEDADCEHAAFMCSDCYYATVERNFAQAIAGARAAGYAEAKEQAALKCDEFSRDAATCAAREEADCDIAEADIHSHAANCGRTLARTIRALAPATTKEPT